MLATLAPQMYLQGGHGGLFAVGGLHVGEAVHRCVQQGVDASHPLVWPTAEESFRRVDELREQFHTAMAGSNFMEAIGEVK